MPHTLPLACVKTSEKKQCWEVMGCGTEQHSACDAVAAGYGKACWLVAGTLNGSRPTCFAAQNISSCKECRFYRETKGCAHV